MQKLICFRALSPQKMRLIVWANMLLGYKSLNFKWWPTSYCFILGSTGTVSHTDAFPCCFLLSCHSTHSSTHSRRLQLSVAWGMGMSNYSHRKWFVLEFIVHPAVWLWWYKRTQSWRQFYLLMSQSSKQHKGRNYHYWCGEGSIWKSLSSSRLAIPPWSAPLPTHNCLIGTENWVHQSAQFNAQKQQCFHCFMQCPWLAFTDYLIN